MKLLYFTEANLRRTPFVKQFVSEFNQFKDKCILVLAPFGSASDTRFVTKRVSSLLSEVLAVNMPLSGDQKHLLTRKDGQLHIQADLLHSTLETLQMVVVNPLIADTDGEIADPLEMIQAIRDAMPIEETLVFLTNSRSPLAAERKSITGPADIEAALNIYEEEQAALESAAALAPTQLVSAANYAKP